MIMDTMIFDPVAPVNVSNDDSIFNTKPRRKIRAPALKKILPRRQIERPGAIHEDLPVTHPMPYEAIIVDVGVKSTAVGEIVNIDDVKAWDMIQTKKASYLGIRADGVGEVNHKEGNNNLLLRGGDDDRVISEITTYMNTAVDKTIIVNISQRSGMPRSIAPVSDTGSSSYIFSMMRKKLGDKFKLNYFYVVKSSVFRISDALSAQKFCDYIESIGQDASINNTALVEAKSIRRKVHELSCGAIGVDPQSSNNLIIEQSYGDRTLGIIHTIYSLALKDIPGHEYSNGSLFLTNLDLSISIGQHQNPPVHPTLSTYSNYLIHNPAAIDKNTPSVFTGYNYYVTQDSNASDLYVIINNEILKLTPRTYPVRLDSGDNINEDIIRMYRCVDTDNPADELLDSDSVDVKIEDAISSELVYASYEQASIRLEKMIASKTLDLYKAKADIQLQESNMKKLKADYDAAVVKHRSLLTEIEHTTNQQKIKSDALQAEHNSKLVTEADKRLTALQQLQVDKQVNEYKMASAMHTAKTDYSAGNIKVAIASLTAVAAGIALYRTFNK